MTSSADQARSEEVSEELTIEQVVYLLDTLHPQQSLENKVSVNSKRKLAYTTNSATFLRVTRSILTIHFDLVPILEIEIKPEIPKNSTITPTPPRET